MKLLAPLKNSGLTIFIVKYIEYNPITNTIYFKDVCNGDYCVKLDKYRIDSQKCSNHAELARDLMMELYGRNRLSLVLYKGLQVECNQADDTELTSYF